MEGSLGTIRFCLLVALLGIAQASLADFEVTGPDGRRILLKDDNTWRYLEKPADDKKASLNHVLIRVESKTALVQACRFGLRMVNNLPYEIVSIVPQFSAFKANNVLYDTVFMAFSRLRPTDNQYREIQFNLPCTEVDRIQVSGADRCEMGDLGRFSDEKGQCLSRVRLADSDLVRFTK